MDYKSIQVEHRRRTGVITLNRPDKRNAISIAMRQEISECLGIWRDDPGIGVVIFTGIGEIFSAGFDLEEFQRPEKFAELYQSSARYHRDIWNFPKPTIAAINGAAVGGGFDLATLSDLRLCSDNAFFGHPEIKFGAPPIFTPLQKIVGHGLARDLCLTGRRIDAEQALRIGLVSEVVSSEMILKKALQMADGLLEAPTATLQYVKQVFLENSKDFEESFLLEHDRAFKEIILKGGNLD